MSDQAAWLAEQYAKASAENLAANRAAEPKPSDTWTVTNRDGQELARVNGATHGDAVNAARMIPDVAASSNRENGFGMRRLLESEIEL
jgi:hypothetical protein